MAIGLACDHQPLAFDSIRHHPGVARYPASTVLSTFASAMSGLTARAGGGTLFAPCQSLAGGRPMHTAFIAAIPLRRVVCPLAVVAGVFVVLCTLALPAFAQRPHVVYGTVVDAASAVPIPYVEVWLVRDQHVVT